ncbi:MAG: hypothetical protein HC896_17515 [Bacteroidales bacterium]|nr:hypothetical protein [Bacteroidales bacterium]
MLKSGGSAFVPESKSSFPPIETIIKLIVDAGGIPCYPVLLDDKNGNLTEFETGWDNMADWLTRYNVPCIELIPSRNSEQKLTEFVKFFKDKGFVITLGTEHNTPGLFPLEVKMEGTMHLTNYLKKVSYEGCCLIAAHQYLEANAQEGFLDCSAKPNKHCIAYLSVLGNAVIKNYIE